MNIGLIVIPLAYLLPLSSLPQIPRMAAAFACMTALAFIYRPIVTIGAEKWRCREREQRADMICYRCSVWP